MRKSTANLFEQLRRGSPIPDRTQQAATPRYKLQFIGNECFLSVVDDEGVPVDIDHNHYSGSTRRLLKSIEQLLERFNFSVDSVSDAPLVSLTENEFLVWQLAETGLVVDENLVPIRFDNRAASILLTISDKSQLECVFSLRVGNNDYSDINLIGESFCLADQTIFSIAPIGDNYELLPSFETLILPSELEKYLSLLFSYFDNIQLVYLDYQVIKGVEISPSPSLIIEKISPDGSLYLKSSITLPQLDPDFLGSYDVSRVARLDHQSRVIHVSPINKNALIPDVDGLRGLLNRRKKLENDLESVVYEEDTLFIISSPLAESFILKDLPGLGSEYAIFGAENLSSYQMRVVKPEIRLSLDHGTDFLEGSAELIIGDDVFSLFEALYIYRQNSYIQLSDGSRALIDQEYIERLERVFQKKRDKAAVSFFDLPLIDELIDSKVADSALNRHRSVFEGFSRLDQLDVDVPELNARYRPYQVDGFKWLTYLRRHRLGGCLADDMGLGKTIQTIALMSSIYPDESRPSLIIVPKSLIHNWCQEIKRFNPRLSVYVYYGPDRDIAEAKMVNLIVTTYGMVRNDIEVLSQETFHYVVLDESQNIKNLHSQAAKAVAVLNTEHKLALSGTPIENNLSELYSLFRFLNPGMFGSLESFNYRYLIPIQQRRDEYAANELKRKIYPFMLRRLKKDVLHDLPDKVEQVLTVEMSTEHKNLYEQRRQFYYSTAREQILSEGVERTRFFVLQALTDLRQIASIPEIKSDGLIISPKREILRQMVGEAIANQHKILMFANFLGILDVVAEDLGRDSVEFEVMTGATRKREEVVARFQDDENIKVFLMTLKTGGHGLNLTAADMVFIFDPWWNSAAENQAIDRSHRIGQRRTVFSYKLVTKGTIEEKILKLQQQKKKLADSIITDDTSAVKSLDAEDIEYILGDLE